MKQVPDMVVDEGLQAVGRYCPLLEELRVFPAVVDLHYMYRVTEEGLVYVSHGCHRLQYIYYYCKAMTNSAVVTVVNNCPNLTHFRICNIYPQALDWQTNEPFDEAFGYVVQMCKKLRRLEVSGLVTDQSFEDIGLYAANLEILAVELEGSNDLRMLTPLKDCPKLRKLELKNCFFGRSSITELLDRYEIMRYLWMTGCQVTTNGCILRVDYCMPEDDW